ncbi:MAG: hypothetical protein COA81_12625 [Alphaproteobacteria bacterium]|nr:MAG: hypothetical protein COA81_12625 [Alphaproteobacteria bacterium]
MHTNTIEGYFGIFKRGMKSIYQHCKSHHLKRYLAEFNFGITTKPLMTRNELLMLYLVLSVKGCFTGTHLWCRICTGGTAHDRCIEIHI